MPEIIAAILALLLTSITGYLYSRFLKSPKSKVNTRFLLIAFSVVALSVIFLSTYILKPSPPIIVVDIETATPESSPTPSKTSTPSTSTKVPTNTGVPTPFPSPAIGIIGTESGGGLFVQQWNVKYVCRKKVAISVEIIGATISGGSSPYEITFFQNNNVISTVKVYSSSENKISFSEPILANTGTYLHVSIRSNPPDGNLRWDDDLFFPKDFPYCPKD